MEGIAKWPFLAIGQALEVIPRTLAQNCGANVIRLLTELRFKDKDAVMYSSPTLQLHIIAIVIILVIIIISIRGF